MSPATKRPAAHAPASERRLKAAPRTAGLRPGVTLGPDGRALAAEPAEGEIRKVLCELSRNSGALGGLQFHDRELHSNGAIKEAFDNVSFAIAHACIVLKRETEKKGR